MAVGVQQPTQSTWISTTSPHLPGTIAMSPQHQSAKTCFHTFYLRIFQQLFVTVILWWHGDYTWAICSRPTTSNSHYSTHDLDDRASFESRSLAGYSHMSGSVLAGAGGRDASIDRDLRPPQVGSLTLSWFLPTELGQWHSARRKPWRLCCVLNCNP